MNATEPPMSKPMKVFTSATLIWVWMTLKTSEPSIALPMSSTFLPRAPMLFTSYFRPSSLAIVSM